MTRTKTKKKAAAITNGQPQTAAEVFLKNGPNNAAKALKRKTNLKPPPRVERKGIRPSHIRPRGRADPRLIVKEAVAKSKHQTYYELVENTEKKKKLEFTITSNRNPPPGFTFVPVGNPELTQLCKEISREQDCMIFVVSATGERHTDLYEHMHRLGYHFRSVIVEEASSSIELQSVRRGGVNVLQSTTAHYDLTAAGTYPIPESQDEINREADAAIRDLFPRIPNTDRQQIIDHAFQRGKKFGGKAVVGTQEELPLSRRVQLAVLAHIRHTHTRYDKLLRETDWATARATIESTCLEILVRWRGDEETGRDQMDEVLREVVIISDSEESDSEETADNEDDEMEEGEVADAESDQDARITEARPPLASHQHPNSGVPDREDFISLISSQHPATMRPASGADTIVRNKRISKLDRVTKRQAKDKIRKERKGFKRYEVWSEALNRQNDQPDASFGNRPKDNSRQDAGDRTGLYENNRIYSTFPGDMQESTAGPSSHVTPHKATYHGGEFIDLTDSPYRQKVMHEQREIQVERHEFSQMGQHSSLVRDHAASGVVSPLKIQDLLLPSIEQASDRVVEDRHNLHAVPRTLEVPRNRVEVSARGFPLQSDGTYRDSRGVVRNQDDRRVIYIDENNREVNYNAESSKRFAGNHGEGPSTGSMPHGSVSSSMMYRDEIIAADSRPRFHQSTSGQANFESYPSRAQGQAGDLREPSGSGYQSSMKLQPEVVPIGRYSKTFSMPSAQDIVSRQYEVSQRRAPAELSGLHPISASQFSEKSHGVAHAEQFSHLSSQLRQSAAYGQGNFEEPILISEKRDGAVRYFQEPAYARCPQYGEHMPVRPASTAHYGRRQVVEYVDVDRPLSENERNGHDRYAGRHLDGLPIPTDQFREPQRERAPIYGGGTRREDRY